MAKTLDILFDVEDQQVYFDAPEGRPSSVTSVTVFRASVGDDGTAQDALDAAAVETNPNTTFDDDAGESEADPRLLPLAATTGIERDRVYLATNALGAHERVEIEGVISGVSAIAKHPLLNTYASGDSFVSTRIATTVKAAWVADSGNISDDLDPNPDYRVRWEYVVAGKTYVHQTYFDLVRYAGGHHVTPADMEELIPGWSDRLPTYHRDDQGRRIIDQAYNQIRWDLFQVGKPDEMVRNSAAIDELVMHKARLLLERSQDPGSPATEDARSDYQFRLDGMFRVSSKVQEAHDSTGAAAEGVHHGLIQK